MHLLRAGCDREVFAADTLALLTNCQMLDFDRLATLLLREGAKRKHRLVERDTLLAQEQQDATLGARLFSPRSTSPSSPCPPLRIVTMSIACVRPTAYSNDAHPAAPQPAQLLRWPSRLAPPHAPT